MRRVDRAILAICLMLSTAVWSKAAGPVVITSAVTNSTLTQITINGQNFGATRPAVTLGGTPLKVMRFNATPVVAALPPNRLRTYLLRVSVGTVEQTPLADATI